MTQTTFNVLKRRLLSAFEPGQAREVAVGPGFDAGDRTIHAVYRTSATDDGSSGGIERIGYLVVSDARSEFIRTARGPQLWLVGIAGVMTAVALGAVLRRWLRAD